MAKTRSKRTQPKTLGVKVAKSRLFATTRASEDIPFLGWWTSSYSYASLAFLTVACLLPFSGRAFHVDDTLFVLAARQISQHPLDPYGFSLIWNTSLERMADITKNPPLACYYLAAVGRIAGWSERALHLAFLAACVGIGSRNLPPGKAFHAFSPFGCVGHGSNPRAARFGLQRDVRHDDGGILDLGGDSVDRRPAAA